MRLIFLFLLIVNLSFSQVKLLSWNIENLGRTKSPETISYIAGILKDYDVVALQEVVAGYGGSKAVALLANELNRTGSKWNYTISNPTISSAYKTERYVYLWKPSKVKKIGKAWLEQKYNLEIDREPYFCTFSYNNKTFTVVNFHAITKSQNPETEIKYFKYFPKAYPKLNLIFAADFNCPQSHTVFNPLRKMSFLPAFVKQRTSLKKTCKNNKCLASEYDNIWFNTTSIKLIQSKAVHFYHDFNTLELARHISDHIPITIEFVLE